MAYTGTIVTVAKMQFYAGKNVDATGDVEANHQQLANEAEAFLSNFVKYDIVTNWASLSDVYKLIFSEYAARYGAIGLIAYNMEGYTTRAEAENMINIHWARLKEIQEILKNMSVQDFMGV